MAEHPSEPSNPLAPPGLATLAEGQRQVVDLLAKEAPLGEVLDALCLLVEGHLPGALCSVLLLEGDGLHVKSGAGPTLPPGFLQSFDGQQVGPQAGSCGTAMFRKEAVLVEDIATDPLWEDYKEAALSQGIFACASTPILDGSNRVIGSFALYHGEPGPFSPAELELLHHMNNLAALAISHHGQLDDLREQVGRLAMAQRIAHLGFWTWFVAENRVEWSEGLFDIYGLDPSAFQASFEGYLQRVHPEDRVRVQAIIGGALERRAPFAFEERILRPDEEVRWLRSWGTVLVDEQGAPTRMMGTCVDITEVKSGERELLQFQALVENSPDFVAMGSLDGRVLYVNPAGLKLVGLESLEAARACTIQDFLTEEGFKQSQEVEIPEILAHGQWEGESTLRHFGGDKPVPVHISSFLVKDPATGAPLFLGTFQHDMRLQKKTEEAFRQAQKQESLAVLAGGIAHDFNNLLTAILGNLELAKSAVPHDDRAENYFDRMSLAVARASELARQMLAYSGKGRLVVRSLDLNALIQENAELITASLPKKVRLSLDLAEGLPSLEADATQLQQVVMNLVINAVDAMGDSEGSITLRTRALEMDFPDTALIFPVGPPQPGSYVRLEVEDEGIGMPPPVLARIFDPFFTTKPTGRGLGLSAMLGILRGHRGGIQVESEVGRGTRFSLLFPASRTVPQRPKALSGTPFPSGGLVLVVDDEPSIREAGVAMLEQLGFQCLQASDGHEAVEFVRSRGADLRLVLLDLSMPRLDGREAFHQIHALHPELKVILSSGFDIQETARGIVGQGLAGFLQKPYRLSELKSALQAALTD